MASPTLRALRVPTLVTAAVALVLGCGNRPPTAKGGEPSASVDPPEPEPASVKTVEPVVPVDAPPPMYKPSSRSAESMSIADAAYGAYGDAPDAPGMGATLPDFSVALADGGSFDLATARAAGPVLVMFYRGFW